MSFPFFLHDKPLGRVLGRFLGASGRSFVLFDNSPKNIKKARKMRVSAAFGLIFSHIVYYAKCLGVPGCAVSLLFPGAASCFRRLLCPLWAFSEIFSACRRPLFLTFSAGSNRNFSFFVIILSFPAYITIGRRSPRSSVHCRPFLWRIFSPSARCFVPGGFFSVLLIPSAL